MTEAVQALRRRRVKMLLINLAYFIALLVFGVLIFLQNAGGVWPYMLVCACLAGYLLLVRPQRQSYVRTVRETILLHTVCGGLQNCVYRPKEGVPPTLVHSCGLVSVGSPSAFISRELMTGKAGAMTVKMADVTFPVVEGGRNAMFSGAFLELKWPGVSFPKTTVKAGETDGVALPQNQQALVEKLNGLIPGSLYLCADGDKLTLLLRGRFLGFPVNPLMEISQQTLSANPFPELNWAVELAHVMN